MDGVTGPLYMATRRPHKEDYMKKIIVLVLLMVFGIATIGYCATNWSKFENKGNNLAVEGYQGQPGYIAFYDGNGNVKGYLYFNERAGELFWVTPDGLAMSTGTQIDAGGEVGVPVSDYTGTGGTP